MRRTAAALLAILAIACGRPAAHVDATGATTTTTHSADDGRLHCVTEVAGARVDPPADNVAPVWTVAQAREAIANSDFFRETLDGSYPYRLLVGVFSGDIPNALTAENHLTASTTLTNATVWVVQVGELPMTGSMTNTSIAGYQYAAFLDGVTPIQSVGGVGSGGEAAVTC